MWLGSPVHLKLYMCYICVNEIWQPWSQSEIKLPDKNKHGFFFWRDCQSHRGRVQNIVYSISGEKLGMSLFEMYCFHTWTLSVRGERWGGCALKMYEDVVNIC